MNKKNYEFAEMEIVMVENTDVICTSTGEETLDGIDTPEIGGPEVDPSDDGENL